jgi:uncharacterized membrane protein YvbJ
MKICPRCGFDNRDDANFCRICGQDLRGRSFCSHCARPSMGQTQAGQRLTEGPYRGRSAYRQKKMRF